MSYDSVYFYCFNWQPTLRNEATLTIQKILGVTNKDDLLDILEARGFIKGFMDNLGDEVLVSDLFIDFIDLFIDFFGVYSVLKTIWIMWLEETEYCP